MAKRPLEIDMCSSSQLRDTQGEMLNVEGADITELELGKGRLNDNHGKGFFNCLGKITAAKKIFKAEDCENDRQKYYWEKVKSPYIYVRGVLFDDEDHPNAKAAAAILRNIHKTDCPLKIKASVEGGVISRGLSDPALLARTKIHSVALTFVPANQATLVEPLNLEKGDMDTEADMILIKSVLHLAETNVPSFRHIIRDASAEKIENNINEIIAALGNDATISLKQELIKDSLHNKIVENVVRINEMVHAEVERMNKSSFRSALAGAAIMAASHADAAVPEAHQELYKSIAQEEPLLGAIGFIESSGGTNYNHEKDKKGWSAGGMFGMRPAAAALVLHMHPELAKKYPELAEAAKDLEKNHSVLTERFNNDPEAAADFAKALLKTNKENTRSEKMLIHSWNHGLKGTWDRYKNEGPEAIEKDEYVQKVLKAIKLAKAKTVSKDEDEMDKKELDSSLGYSFSHEHHDLGDGDMITHIKAHHPNGTVVGEAAMEYNHKSPSMKPDVSVHPDFRRQGIATAMYNHAQKVVNKPVAPSSAQSNDAKALWAGAKGSFGKALMASHNGIMLQTNSLIKMEALEKGKKELLSMYKPEHLESGKQHVEWAQKLPKNNWKEWAVKNHATNPSDFTDEHKTAITHFASLDHPLVRNVPLSATVSLEDGLQKLKAGEDAYKEKVGQKDNLLTPEENQRKISHFGFNKGWFDLKKPYCEKEAKAMGHCGNVEGQERPTDNILSFRDITANGKHKPHLTFIENDGWLGETKGTANTKPGSKHHEAITQLLKNPRIKGIAGGGYEAQNNFEFEDLDPKLQKEVMEANPNFVPNIKTPNNIDRALANNLPTHHKMPLIQDNPNLDPRHHEKLVNDEDSSVREAMAKHPNLDPRHHEKLVNDEDNYVRASIAERPDLDPRHHEKLVNDEESYVRASIARNPDLDPKHHEKLVNDEDKYVRTAIARNPDLDPKHHEKLVNDEESYVREAIAEHPNLDPKHHEKLVNDEVSSVRTKMARDPDLDPRHHEKLVNDEESYVREAIAERPNLDPKHHEKLVNDEDKYVREAMARNPRFLKKALMAGYGGSGSPTSMTGGSVLQAESQKLGPKGLNFITCDGCGKEQVYGKFQVKCREPDCGKTFSMAKLEKFFELQKSKQSTPEEQAKINDFMQRKAKGLQPHATQNTGTKGHLPPQREGTFHNEGATTSGKITKKGFAFQNQKTGERGFGSHVQQEQHHWAWDHDKKKWNHIRTSYGSANR